MNLDAGNIINLITAALSLGSVGFLLYKFRKGELPKMQQDGAGVITQASLSLVQEIKKENIDIKAQLESMEKLRETERVDFLEQIRLLKLQLQTYMEDDLRIVMVIGDRPKRAKDVQISYVKSDDSL